MMLQFPWIQSLIPGSAEVFKNFLGEFCVFVKDELKVVINDAALDAS